MKVGIISDTHIEKEIHRFEEFIKKNLNDVDIIIHGGDYKSSEVIHILKKYKKFAGVWGNVDGDDIKQEVLEKEILHLAGYKIGIYHGHGSGKTTPDRAYEAFTATPADIIIFGHSHQPLLKTKNSTLLINPGSPTTKRRERWFSYVLLNLTEEEIGVEMKFFIAERL